MTCRSRDALVDAGGIGGGKAMARLCGGGLSTEGRNSTSAHPSEIGVHLYQFLFFVLPVTPEVIRDEPRLAPSSYYQENQISVTARGRGVRGATDETSAKPYPAAAERLVADIRDEASAPERDTRARVPVGGRTAVNVDFPTQTGDAPVPCLPLVVPLREASGFPLSVPAAL
jgi:hypothetical protein